MSKIYKAWKRLLANDYAFFIVISLLFAIVGHIVEYLFLLDCKVLINLIIPKQRVRGAEIETVDFRSFVIDNSLKDILTDYGFRLNGSRIGLSKHPGGNGANIAITPFNVHLAQSKRKCRWANQVDEADGEKHFSLVGVGAIGSHILNNCLRSGYGKWTIIDHDYFWPHNIARHVLTSNDIGYSKVESMEKVANHIQSDSDLVAIASDVFGLFFRFSPSFFFGF